MSPEARAHARSTLKLALARYHREHPHDDGMLTASLLASLPANAATGLATRALEMCLDAGEFVGAGERVRLATFESPARACDPKAEAIWRQLLNAGLAPPTLSEVARGLGIELPRARGFASALAEAGKLVHVQGDLWFSREAIDGLQRQLVDVLREKQAITTGEFKQLVGASRKYVVPLAEWFDAQRITLRVGDLRRLRGGAG